ncbi:MAG: hypothetical protein OEM52_13045, partial [bacterium]|nr:hypothetical protein [bacterium]
STSVPSIVLWELQVSPNAALTEHITGFGKQVQPEPREERTPMGKLLAANWITQPNDTVQEQLVRWKNMAQTEFDDPKWKLGGNLHGMTTQP